MDALADVRINIKDNFYDVSDIIDYLETKDKNLASLGRLIVEENIVETEVLAMEMGVSVKEIYNLKKRLKRAFVKFRPSMVGAGA